MLQTIRDNLTGWIAGFILALLVVPFVFWGVDFSGTSASTAASVNGEDVPVTEVRRAFQNQLSFYQQFRPEGLDEAQQQQIRQRVLDSFVQVELLDQRAEDKGYRIGDYVLGEAVQKEAAFQVDGRFSEDSYRRLLAIQGESPASYEQRLRRSLRIEQLQKMITASAFVSPADVARRISLEMESRETGFLKFSPESYREQASVEEAEIEARYEANSEDYRTPETVALEYIELRRSDIVDEVSVAESDIRSLYDEELEAGRFVAPEERRARHILLRATDGEDNDAVLDRARALAERVNAGEDFAALAEAESQDGATAPEGGDLGWVTREDLTGPFSEALFAMEPGENSDPVETEFGFHIIRLEEMRGGSARPYAEVRDELDLELRERAAENRFYEFAESLAEAAFESPDSLRPAADELGLSVATLESVTRDSGELVAANQAVRDAAFSTPVLTDGENSDLVELEPGHVVVLRVAEHSPATVRPLTEVRDQIREELLTETAVAMAREAGLAAAARLKAGEDPETLAEELGAEWNASRPLARGDAEAPAGLVAAVFRAPRPAEGSPVIEGVELADGSYAVFSVFSAQAGAGSAGQQTARQRQLAQTLGNQELGAYIGELRREADVFVNEQALQ